MTSRLGVRALGRATLARQFLAERADVTVLEAVSHLAGLQAQEPLEPFVGLWSRLRAFDPDTLSTLLSRREVVRMHLMRRTVHLVTARDALAWRTRHEPMLRQRVLGVYRDALADVDLDELATAARTLLDDGHARTAPEIGRAMAQRWPSADARALGEAVGAVVPTVQIPPRGLWGRTGSAHHVLLGRWLDREPDGAEPADSRPTRPDPTGPDPAGADLVLRYLAAFGPAASADLRAWCGLAGLPDAVRAVRDRLVAFRDERGRELLDLPDAPRPDPDTPAPARYLPAFDNAILGYDDRSRIIDDAHRGLSVAGRRAVLVDGRVAATWTVEAGTVTVTPLRAFTRADRTAVAEEGRALAAFLTDGESHRVRITASPR